MTLMMAQEGEENIIRKVTGKDEIRSFLLKLGFIEGENITVISKIAGNMIIDIKDSRIAIDRDMANRIII